MNLLTNILGLFCFTFYSQTEVFTETVISAQKSLHQENSSGIFYCSTSVDWSLLGVRFVIFNVTNSKLFARINFATVATDNCTHLSDANDHDDIDYDCVNKTFFKMVIHNITRQFYHLKMKCEVFSNSNVTSTSQSIFFNVSVPVTKAYVVEENNSYIEANENINTDITCKTSPAFPVSRVSWYINNELVTTNVTSKTIKDVGSLLITESTLTIKPKRQMNGPHIYCSASNDVDDTVIVKSSISTLLVYYPPTEVTFDINSKPVTSVNIIKGNSLALRCNSDSYPKSYFTWNNGGTLVSQSRTLRINDIRENEHGNYTCEVRNHKANKSNTVIVKVLVPVSSPSLLFNGSSKVIIGPIDVIKNDNFSVLCNSTGSPLPNNIWNDGNRSSLLTIKNIQNDYNNTCTVSNTLVETVGENKTFTRNTSLAVRVLYPPRPACIQLYMEHGNKSDILNTNITIEEFKNFNLSCSTVSIPESNYIWKGPVSSKTSLLKMDNLTRNASGEYTCFAYKEMKRTFGKQKIGAAKRSIFVEIVYAASISRFDLSSLQGDKMVTGTGNGEPMTEPGHNVSFNCVVDSNPSSNITVFFRNEILVSNPNTKNLTHKLYNISCDDAGLYHCSGFNDYNRGKVSTKKIAVFVKCPPAPDIGQVKYKVTTLKFVPATLTFVAREYFDTDDTQFEWQKLSNTSVWETVRNYFNDDVNVTIKRLQTSLHIPNVTEYHTGSYRVVYNNSAGGNIHSFHLNIADIPDAPAKFSAESIRETDITVTWTKGYNGGVQQIFILQYNRTSQHEFENTTIHETDEMTFKHTITGLSSGSVYKMILWAANELGFNKTPQTLVIRTEVAANLVRFYWSISDPNATGPRNGLSIIDPGQNVSIYCDVDSNSPSVITVTFGNQVKASDTSLRRLIYKLDNISCNDAGLYHCSAFNKYYRGIGSTEQLAIYVKCPPLPEVGKFNKTVTTLKYEPVVLRFVAKEYFDIGVTKFIWQKLSQTSSVWENVSNVVNAVTLTNMRIQTFLVITNVTEAHTGTYRVVYNNSAGGNIQELHLYIAEKIRPCPLSGIFIGSVIGLILLCSGIAMGIFFYKRTNIRQKAESVISPAYENIPFTVVPNRQPTSNANEETNSRIESEISQHVYESIP